MVKVRIATPSDAASILAIYLPYILTTAFTFETIVPSVQEFQQRIENYLQKFPWIVCEIDGSIVGYTYPSTHREREAYQWTCECSVYINENFKGKGIGKELYDALFKILKLQGLMNVFAGITLPNDASIGLHEKCGFTLFAVYDNIGYKLNAWHKVGWLKLQLHDYEPKPSPPLLFSKMNNESYLDVLQQAAITINAKIN